LLGRSCHADDAIRDFHVTGVQTCALPIPVGPPVGRQLWRPGRPGRQPRRRPARRIARLDSSTPVTTAPTTAAMPATDFSPASGSEAGGAGSTVATGGLLRVPSTAVTARYGLTTP